MTAGGCQMTRLRSLLRRLRSAKGTTLVFVALTMVVMLGIAALAIDVGYAYVVRGELQNAADSGALAGTQVLYLNNGTAINTGADAVASDYATRHQSELATVTVESVERGHWSFGLGTLAKGFYPNNSTVVVSLANVSTAELDQDPNFINAVRVVTRRRADALPFFARVLGQGAPLVRTTAVSYIGFAGTLEEAVADQPIAICDQSIRRDDEYSCSVGRMLNSDPNDEYSGTGGWTNFEQPDDPNASCGGASSASQMRQLICSSGNPGPLLLGYPMSTIGGVADNVFRDLKQCWENAADTNGDNIPDTPWELTLPVVICSNEAGPTSCSTLVGAVVVNVVWIIRDNPACTGSGPCMTPQPADTPHQMAGVGQFSDWVCPAGYSDTLCWTDFTQHFNLQAPDFSPAIASSKTIYFLPDCDPHIPMGGTGGQNFGVLARVPVLVCGGSDDTLFGTNDCRGQ